MVDVSTEERGRYTEIYIDGVPDGAVCYDEKENELIVACEDFRNPEIGVVAELEESDD